MTFRLQTAGISLLAPELIVYDASGNVLGQAQSTNVLGDTVTVRLNSIAANTTYYIRVEAATSDLFAVGRYGLAVTFDATLKTTPNQIAAMLGSMATRPAAILRTTPSSAVSRRCGPRGGMRPTSITKLGAASTAPSLTASSRRRARRATSWC